MICSAATRCRDRCRDGLDAVYIVLQCNMQRLFGANGVPLAVPDLNQTVRAPSGGVWLLRLHKKSNNVVNLFRLFT
jgi:hypothetical protein